MSVLPGVVQDLIEQFEKLPGVGPKSAARMAYHFLRAPKQEVEQLAKAAISVKEGIVDCEVCFNVAEQSPCLICADSQRDQNAICVVEEPLDVVAFERGGEYKGVYHVLGGVISPVNGIGPEELRIEELVKRVKEKIADDSVKEIEVILATNPNMEGEATSLYIKQELEGLNSSKKAEKVRISRLARGLPTGADLEYADAVTLRKALEGRTEY